MITTTRMQQIMVQVATGRKPKPATDEEKTFIKEVTKEIADIGNKGGTVEIPAEYPDAD